MEKVCSIVNCRECGRLFVKKAVDQTCCDYCKGKDYQKISKIRSYAIERKSVTVDELSSLAQVDKTSIVRLVTQGKLSYYNGLKINCRICGHPIDSAQRRVVCHKCYASLNKYSPRKGTKIVIKSPNKWAKAKVEEAKPRIVKKKYAFKRQLSKNRIYYQHNPWEPEELPDVKTLNPTLKLSDSKCRLPMVSLSC